MESLRTIVSPPIFCDWEDLHRIDGSGNVDVEECFRRWQRAFVKFLVLFAFEHVLLLVPLALLWYEIESRNRTVRRGLGSILADESHVTALVSAFLFGGAALALVLLPTAQMLLARAYFLYGHPWARILRRELDEEARTRTRTGSERVLEAGAAESAADTMMETRL